MHACVLSHFSRAWLCSAMDCSPPGSSVHGFSRQEYRSGLPCPPPGDLPNSGIGLACTSSWLLQQCCLPFTIKVRLEHFCYMFCFGRGGHTVKLVKMRTLITGLPGNFPWLLFYQTIHVVLWKVQLFKLPFTSDIIQNFGRPNVYKKVLTSNSERHFLWSHKKNKRLLNRKTGKNFTTESLSWT